ncbi:hypothetical protein M9H77_29915 [Catharanthus roseus]|uniref:Uncharacterized protein n=1 Tax=Catharanthus roseus TaxID=4058 RepID=A0ACB9ZXZ1_CATRO|nr:hypothetical protein M9H77_29915 [Catharanthus roseus]
MQGRNTVDEVLRLSAEKGYTVFHRNREDSNVVNDIVVAHQTSIAIIRTWPHVLIMDTTYKTNNTWLNPFAHKFCTVWTFQVLHFGIETTNRAESEHSVLKLWLSTCHGDLDTVFLNIDSLIQGQIAEDLAVIGPVYHPLVVSNFLFGDENHWVEIRRRMSYDLQHRMNVSKQFFGSVERVTELIMKTNWEEGLAPPECWMDTPDHHYVIANTFNLCVIFLARSESTTVLPLVSNMDGPAGTIFIGLIEELQHFIQELTGMAETLVHDSVSKCEGASSHSASIKVFLKTYILLFGGQRAS